MVDIQIQGAAEGDKTLQQFQELIEKRRQLLGETTEQSVAACSIQILKSLRATTKVADVKKPFSGKVVEHQSVYLSFRSIGKSSKKSVPCLRRKGGGQIVNTGKMPLIIVSRSLKAKNAKIFTWMRRSGKVYWIAAADKGQAEKWVKNTEKKRIKKYRGLAKHALGRLMHKVANTSGVSDNVNKVSETVAENNTSVSKQSTGFNSGVYTLTMKDELRYAIDALQGGHFGDITNAMQKAMNSINKVIEKRIGRPLEQTNKQDNFEQ